VLEYECIYIIVATSYVEATPIEATSLELEWSISYRTYRVATHAL
jgi:hypothetical protein